MVVVAGAAGAECPANAVLEPWPETELPVCDLCFHLPFLLTEVVLMWYVYFSPLKASQSLASELIHVEMTDER